MEENKILLDVKHLCTSFFTPAGEVKAVNDVSYYVREQEIVAVVGESGSGKSVTQMSVMQLVQTPPGRILGGKVLFEGQNLLAYKPNSKQMQAIRGAQIAMIFQEPMTSLNPVYTVGNQITEVIRRHKKCSRREAWRLGTAALDSVGSPDPETRMKNYPFEMSGGMRQRVLIAIAVACNSKLIIADEPTTALDVTIQAQILELMQSLQQKLGMAIIMVTHDLGVIAEMCDEIVVMYGGRFCERGTADEIFYNPRHEYTRGLLRSIPNITNMKERLVPISGTPINMLNMPKGCAFCARCDKAMKICLEQVPEERIINESHRASCWINTRDNIGTVEEAE